MMETLQTSAVTMRTLAIPLPLRPYPRRLFSSRLYFVLTMLALMAACQTGEYRIPTQAVHMTETATAIVAFQQTASATATSSDVPTPSPTVAAPTPTRTQLPPATRTLT